MMRCGQKMGRSFWIKRAIFFPIAIAAGIFIFGWVVMQLWNGILPAVLGVHIITFWQALGILVLSKILFGGFHGCHCRPRSHHGSPWSDKWKNMNPDEREKIKAEWDERFKHTTSKCD
jgi:hypothetical protein